MHIYVRIMAYYGAGGITAQRTPLHIKADVRSVAPKLAAIHFLRTTGASYRAQRTEVCSSLSPAVHIVSRAVRSGVRQTTPLRYVHVLVLCECTHAESAGYPH